MSMVGNGKGYCENALISGIRFRPKQGSEFRGKGVSIVDKGLNVRFEDLDIQWFMDGFVIDNGGKAKNNNEWYENLYVGGCVIARNGNGRAIDGADDPDRHAARSQGGYFNGVRGIIFEYNIVALNGFTTWHPPIQAQLPADVRDDDRANASIYSHGIYTQYWCDDRPDRGQPIIFRNNYCYRNGSHGIQLRSGGVLENNVFHANGLGAFVGSPEAIREAGDMDCRGICNNNLVIEGENINNKERRNWALHLRPVDQPSEMKNNVIISDGTGQNRGLEYDNDAPGNATVTISGNIVAGYGSLVLFSSEVNGNLVVADNKYDLGEDGLGDEFGGIYRRTGGGNSVDANDFQSSGNEQISYNAPKMTDVYGSDLVENLLRGIMPSDPADIVEFFRNDALG